MKRDTPFVREVVRLVDRTPGFRLRRTKNGHIVVTGPRGTVTFAQTRDARGRHKDVARLQAIGLEVET